MACGWSGSIAKRMNQYRNTNETAIDRWRHSTASKDFLWHTLTKVSSILYGEASKSPAKR